MSVTAPKIDDRTWQQIVDRILALAPFYTPEWKAFLQDKESGNALVKLFAHMLEAVIARLNKTPDKNFIAFLDVLGIKALPAR
ncbi:putative baseplate assembly protein, partial [candidate division KSB1 bacterium]|nr:putative baseplate assembly protein [candidate division KSB1 bacterium]